MSRHPRPPGSEAETMRDLQPVRDRGHPDEDELVVLLSGGATTAERGRLVAHLDECAECRALLAELGQSTEPTPIDPLLGAVVSGYRVERFLSRGGMGAVYLASGLDGSRAALKVLLWNVAEDPQFAARLRAEARALMAVQHPSVVKVKGLGELPDGRPWLMMEFIEGQTLTDRLTVQSFNLRGAATLLEQLLGGLEACHAQGLLHRDLKPTNLLVRDTVNGPEVVLIDFGLAKHRDGTAITQANSLVGSLGYLAPELLKGVEASPQSDLYAVGCIAWRLFTGTPVFPVEKPQEVMRRHLLEPAPRLHALLPEAPEAFATWVDRLLSKEPGERYASARAAREALARAKRSLDQTLLGQDDEDDDAAQASTDPALPRPDFSRPRPAVAPTRPDRPRPPTPDEE